MLAFFDDSSHHGQYDSSVSVLVSTHAKCPVVLLSVRCRHGLGLTTWSPLSSGVLTGKYSGGEVPQGSRFSLQDYKVCLAVIADFHSGRWQWHVCSSLLRLCGPGIRVKLPPMQYVMLPTLCSCTCCHCLMYIICAAIVCSLWLKRNLLRSALNLRRLTS